jgi:hypothetical protein
MKVSWCLRVGLTMELCFEVVKRHKLMQVSQETPLPAPKALAIATHTKESLSRRHIIYSTNQCYIFIKYTKMLSLNLEIPFLQYSNVVIQCEASFATKSPVFTFGLDPCLQMFVQLQGQ